MSYGKENRFTLADYDYDRQEEHDTPSQAESSRQAMNKAAAASALASASTYPSPYARDSGSVSTSVMPSLSPPSAVYQPPLRCQSTDAPPSSAGFGGSTGGLRLHEHYPPTSPPPHDPPITSPPMHIAPSLSPANSYTSTHRLYIDPQPLQPLPSIDAARSHDGISLAADEERDVDDGRSMMSDLSEKRHHPYSKENKGGLGFDERVTSAPALVRRPTGTSKSFWKKLIPSTLYTKLLLATILTETIINLAIEGNILYRFKEEVESTTSTDLEFENRRRLPIYLIIFGLAHLWQIVLTVIAIRTKNSIQVMSVTAFNFAFLGYAVIQIYELRKILGDNLANQLTGNSGGSVTLLTIPLNVLTALIIGVVAASCLVLSVLSFFIQREFGWQRYRFLGADLMIREYYFKLQVFECICYFSAFFCAGFGIQFIWLVLNPQDVEYIITWIAFPLLLIFLVIGRFAAKYENKYWMAAFMVGLVAGCAYFIFKLARIWQQSSTTYRSTSKSLTTFDALSLASLIACAAWGFMVWANFNKGLKQALLSRPGALSHIAGFWRTRSPQEEEKGQDISMSQRRISID